MLDDEVNVLLTSITCRHGLITAKCSPGLAMALIPERANFLPPWECYGLLATEVDPYIRVGAFGSVFLKMATYLIGPQFYHVERLRFLRG